MSSNVKVRLLRAFMTLGMPVSGRHAARLIGAAEKTSRVALDDLVNMGMLLRAEATGQYLFSANREHVLWEPLRHLFDAERERIKSLQETLSKAARTGDSTLRSLAIFGSSARGDDAPGSDLDLLAIVDDPSDEQPLRESLVDIIPLLQTTFGEHLSPVVMTTGDFRARHAEQDPFTEAVVREAEVVFGRHPGEVAGG